MVLNRPTWSNNDDSRHFETLEELKKRYPRSVAASFNNYQYDLVEEGLLGLRFGRPRPAGGLRDDVYGS